MDEPDMSRRILATFEGPNIGRGWVDVLDLVAVLQGLQGAIVVVMEDLWGRNHTRGPVPEEILRHATMRFGEVRVGSFGATLMLEPPPSVEPQMFDMQPEAVERLLEGIQAYADGLPSDLPADAIRHVRTVTARITRTEDWLVLEGGRTARRVVISASTGHGREEQTIATGVRNVRLIGRLLEIDYKDRTAEVWDTLGQMTRIRFVEAQRAQVDAARQQYVTVVGVIEVGHSGRTSAVNLESVTPTRIDDSFWRTRSLAELVEEQGVKPIEDPAALVATFWEGDDEDEFLATLRRWRQES